MFFLGTMFLGCEDVQNEEIMQARQILELQKSNLDSMKAQYELQNQQMTTNLPGQIADYHLRIQNSRDVLQMLKNSEQDINQSALSTSRLQNNAAQLARDQVEPQISQLERDLTQTKQQIYYWTNSGFTLTSYQQDLVNKLQTTLAIQQQQLDFLKTERINISSELLNQSQQLNRLNQEQIADLANEQSAIQREIFTLRSEILRLQTTYRQTKSSLIPLGQQLDQAQKLYDQQVEKLRSLEQNSPNP